MDIITRLVAELDRLSLLAETMEPLDERAAGTQNGLRVAVRRLRTAMHLQENN